MAVMAFVVLWDSFVEHIVHGRNARAEMPILFPLVLEECHVLEYGQACYGTVLHVVQAISTFWVY